MYGRLRFGFATWGVALVLWCCGDDGDSDEQNASCPTGSLRCACYRDDTCDAPYECFSNRCVRRDEGGEGGGQTETGGASDGGAAPAAAGEQGSSSGGAEASGGNDSGGKSAGGAVGNGGSSGGSAPSGGRAGSGAGGQAPDPSGGESPSAGDGGVSAVGGTVASGATAGEAGGPVDSGGAAGSGGAPSGVVFFDDFEDLVDDGWTAPAAWQAGSDPTDASNGVYIATAPAGSGICSAIVGDPTWTNVMVEARVKFVEVVSPTSTTAYVGARYQDLARGDYIYVYPSGTGFVTDNRVVNNVSYGNSANFTVEVSEDVWHTLGLKVVGTTATGYFDGQEVAVLPELTRVNGPIGLCASSGVVHFDDVKVTLIDE